MINFIQKHINLKLLIAYFLANTIAYFVLPLLNNDIKNFSFQRFLLSFTINLIPLILLFIYSFKIRFELDNSIRAGKYFITIAFGALYISLLCFPYSISFMYILQNKFSNSITNLNNINEINFIITLMYIPIFYPVFIFSTGAYSRILSKMEVGFRIKEVFYFLKMPFIKTIFIYSLIIYFLPLILDIISLKFNITSFLFDIFNYCIQTISYLLEIFLVMYLIVLWDEVNLHQIQKP